MPNINLQINARGTNVSAERRGNNVVIDIDNTASAAATAAALAAATDVEARADAAIAEVDQAVALLESLTGEQVPLLIALLIPPGATAIAADSRNSVLFILGII